MAHILVMQVIAKPTCSEVQPDVTLLRLSLNSHHERREVEET